MPVLGICRGMQLINVAMGGTLDQHLPESIGDGRHRSTAGSFGTHQVRLAEGTLACGAAGTDGLLVMSHHHQGVAKLGEGLDGQRLVGRRRHRRGDRAARPPLRPRRRLAPRGGRDERDHPGAGRGRRAQLFLGCRRGLKGTAGVSTLSVIEPATAKPMAEIPQAGVEETDAAVARAKAAFPAWRDVTPGDRAKLIHRLADALAAEHEELSRLEARNAGKPIGSAPRRDRDGDRHLPLLRGRAGAAARQDDPGRRRHRHDLPRAARRGRADRPLELPADDRLLEGRPGARRRQHDRPEARRADAADRDRAGADRARGGDPGGRPERRRRARAGSAGSGWSSTPTSPRSPSPARPRSGAGSPAARRRRSSG